MVLKKLRDAGLATVLASASLFASGEEADAQNCYACHRPAARTVPQRNYFHPIFRRDRCGRVIAPPVRRVEIAPQNTFETDIHFSAFRDNGNQIIDQGDLFYNIDGDTIAENERGIVWTDPIVGHRGKRFELNIYRAGDHNTPVSSYRDRVVSNNNRIFSKPFQHAPGDYVAKFRLFLPNMSLIDSRRFRIVEGAPQRRNWGDRTPRFPRYGPSRIRRFH